MTLRLERRYINEMVDHAKADAPDECCGIIAGKDGQATRLYRAVNGVPKEYRRYRYEVESNDLFRINREIDDSDWEWLAVYHSHTATEAYPSPTDVSLAKLRPEPYYVLVSLMDPERPVVRAFRIADGAITEEEIEPA